MVGDLLIVNGEVAWMGEGGPPGPVQEVDAVFAVIAPQVNGVEDLTSGHNVTAGIIFYGKIQEKRGKKVDGAAEKTPYQRVAHVPAPPDVAGTNGQIVSFL